MRIATRASALALAQARAVAAAVPGETEIVEITTAGDRGAEPGSDKSRWVAELERALLDGEADVAVHSAKDVPGTLPDGLEIVAVPARADARDALCGAPSLDAAEDIDGRTGRCSMPMWRSSSWRSTGPRGLRCSSATAPGNRSGGRSRRPRQTP